jgi:hypothetical protein
MVAALVAGSATAVTIDFESLEVAGYGNTGVPSPYAEDGFELVALPGPSGGHFQFFETLNPLYPGSTALFFGLPGMSARLESASGAPFSVVSVDLSLIESGGGFVAFTGYPASGGTVSQEFYVPTGDINLTTFAFSGFENLARLEWSEEFHLGHQLDNLVVQVVPEPASGLLLLMGALLLGASPSARWRQNC